MERTKHPQVVVAYDFSRYGQPVLERAAQLVARAPFHVLHVVTVVEPHAGVQGIPHRGRVDFAYTDVVRDRLGEAIRKAFAAAKVEGQVELFVHARIGKPAEEILGLARDVGADLILVGSHGHTGLERLVMGSVAERVVREAGCAVLVARAKVYADVELEHVIEVERTKPLESRVHVYSYTNDRVILRPPEWPIG